MSSLIPAEGLELDPRDMTMVDALTPLQNTYLHWRLLGYTPTQSAKKTGYGDTRQAVRANEKNVLIRERIANMDEETAVKFNVSRDSVVSIIMEALSVARERSDAKHMLASAVELARITGVEAPEVKVMKVEADVNHHNIEQIPTADLVKMVGKDRELNLLEGDYTDVTDIEDAEYITQETIKE